MLQIRNGLLFSSSGSKVTRGERRERERRNSICSVSTLIPDLKLFITCDNCSIWMLSNYHTVTKFKLSFNHYSSQPNLLILYFNIKELKNAQPNFFESVSKYTNQTYITAFFASFYLIIDFHSVFQ